MIWKILLMKKIKELIKEMKKIILIILINRPIVENWVVIQDKNQRKIIHCKKKMNINFQLIILKIISMKINKYWEIKAKIIWKSHVTQT